MWRSGSYLMRYCRLHPSFFFLVTLVFTLAFAFTPSPASVCRPQPEIALGGDLLASLPPDVQVEREAAVAATLAQYPGAVETFLSALMSWEFHYMGWSNPGLAGNAVIPAQIMVYNNRAWASNFAPPATVYLNKSEWRTQGCNYVSPLLLDLNGNGVPDVVSGDWPAHPGMDLQGPLAAFDIDGDAFRDLTEWLTSAGDGLLVAPVDPGVVTEGPSGLEWNGPLSGRDLLGTAGGYQDGWEKLTCLFDDNLDGLVEGEEIDGLYVWQDLNVDAVIQPGELVEPSYWGISSLMLPLPGECVGSFNGGTASGLLWDWWPSYARATKKWTNGAPVPPASVPLFQEPLPNESYLGSPLPVAPGGWIPTAVLEGRLDYQSLRLAGISPAGDYVILHDRPLSMHDIAAGHGRRLWVLPLVGAKKFITPRIVPLPVADVLQVVFGDPGEVFLVADTGSKLLWLELDTGALTLLNRPQLDQPGFRFGDYAFRDAAGVHFSGCFYNAAGESQYDVVATYTVPVSRSGLAETASRLEILSAVGSLGLLASECQAGPQLSHFVVMTRAAVPRLVTYRNGDVLTPDEWAQPHGLAASGNRVLYFRQPPDQDTYEVRVFDSATEEIFVLGTGDYCYPYLTCNGTRAFVTSIEWQAATMTLWEASVAKGASFQPVLTTGGIGAVRMAEDSGSFVYLGPDGLHISDFALTDVPAHSVPDFRLHQASPNPFNPVTTIRYDLARAAGVLLRIYDVSGRLVRTLKNRALEGAGRHQVVWNGRDESGRVCPSGVYFYRLETGALEETKRMTLVK